MGAVGLIVERIPHNTVSYAYLEIQASNANEFEMLREEALKKIPQYAFALNQPSAPKSVGTVEEPEATQVDAAAVAPPAAVEADAGRGVADLPPAATVPAPTSAEGTADALTIARQRMAAKKGA